MNDPCPLCGREHAYTIGEIATYDPIVHSCLELHFRGILHYEDALIMAIAHLVEENESLRQSLTQYCKPLTVKG